MVKIDDEEFGIAVIRAIEKDVFCGTLTSGNEVIYKETMGMKKYSKKRWKIFKEKMRRILGKSFEYNNWIYTIHHWAPMGAEQWNFNRYGDEPDPPFRGWVGGINLTKESKK